MGIAGGNVLARPDRIRASVWRRISPAIGSTSAAPPPRRPSPAGVGGGVQRHAAARVSVWRRVSPPINSTSAAPPQRCSPAEIVGGVQRRAPARVSVWRWISPPIVTTSDAPPQRSSPTGAASGVGVTQGSTEAHGQDLGSRAGQQRRRRRPPRSQRRPVKELTVGALPDSASSVASREGIRPPPCIIDWSDQVARAEEDLANAVVVSVINDGPLAAVEEVAEVIAARIEVVVSSLVLRRASSSSYLLVLPDLALVERLVGLQQSIRSSGFSFSLLCKRWSRLTGAQGRVLPFLIDIELRGIPSHVWKTSIVDRFLSPHAWLQHVHPDTLGLTDLSCFRCLAWSADPSAIPSSKELWVLEPPTAIVEDPPVKRVLSYPVSIRFSVAPLPTAPNPPSDGGMKATKTLLGGGAVSVPHHHLPALDRRLVMLLEVAVALV